VAKVKRGRDAIRAARGIEPLVAFIAEHRLDEYAFDAIQTIGNLALDDDTRGAAILRADAEAPLRWYVTNGKYEHSHEARIALERLGV
jgi:hypothetical protein